MRKVAIVATSYRLPGTTSTSFWDDLLAGRDLITHVDPERWSSSAYLHPSKSHPGTAYTFAAGTIGYAAGFDAGFFGISPREAALMDPQQRLLLEMSWEAFENAGIRPSSLRGTACGVYVGISSSDYSWRMADDLAAIDASFATGNTASIAANRLSYFYDLRGPSMAIDTACSSSLVAFHQAHRSILSGETHQALVGAISLHLHPLGFISFSKASMLSKSGRCRVFDAAADGYVRSEGGGVFLLKDYDLAVAEGNPILAVIANTAINTDGHKPGLTVPSTIAQAALLTRAYAEAGINPADVDYIEAHGTGTPVGDPVEALAIGEALAKRRPRSQPLPIGSVKGNVGHLEAASGVAGLIKILGCLQHRTIPTHIGMETPNPNIPFRELNLEVVTANRILRSQGRLVMGVNSFGFGGANAHVILESHTMEPATPSALPKARPLPLVISARDPVALKNTAQQLAQFIAGQPRGSLYDVAYQLAHGRDSHTHRAVMFVQSAGSAAARLQEFADGATELHGVESGSPVPAARGAAFIYSGNGAQWAGMGRRLLADPIFRTAVREVDTLFSRYADYSLEAELAAEDNASRYDQTEIAQPALFAVQVGITMMLRNRGIAPVAVAGHSVGEVAAAWAAGTLSLPAAVSVVHHRSKLQGTTRGSGRMSAVSLSESAVQTVLAELGLSSVLTIAGVNSSCGVTIAGPAEPLTQLESTLRSRGIAHVRLALDYAFHSPAMDGLSGELRRALAHLEPEEPTVALYSTVTGQQLAGKAFNADYWWHNIRYPVLFEPAIRAMVQAGINIFMEIGPHAPLLRYIQDALTEAKVEGCVIATGMRGDDSPQRIYSAANRALIAGATVNWEHLLPWRGRYVQLPNYPWQHESYWHPTTSSSLGLIARQDEHPLLGHALQQVDWMWESELDTRKQPWFADHVVGGATVFPGSGYAEIALAAALRWQEADCAAIEDLEIRAPMLLGPKPSRTVRCELDPADGLLSIRSREHAGTDEWSLQASARILREPSLGRQRRCLLGTLPTRAPDFTARSHELLTRAVGLEYGPTFRAISHGWLEQGCALAVFDPNAPSGMEADHYHLHPALLDCAFQLIIQLLREDAAGHDGTTYIPTRIGHFSCRSGALKPHFARARILRRNPHSICADYELFDANGDVIAVFEEVRLRNTRLRRDPTEQVRYFEYAAIPKPMAPARLTNTRAYADLDAGLRQGFADAASRRTQQHYVEEIDPLLDALCERFVAEALRGMPSSQLPPSRFGASLLEDAAGNPDANTDAGTAQDIWNSLIGDYPDFFPLAHAVGCVGVHLSALLHQQIAHSEVLPAHLTRAALQALVLGSAGRLQLVQTLRSHIARSLNDLPEGQRLGLIEIGAHAPVLAAELCQTTDFDRVDFSLVSANSAPNEAARRLQDRYPALAVGSMADSAAAPRDCALAIVTLDFGSSNDTWRALQYAQSRLAVGGALLLIGQHPSRALDFIYGADPAWWSDSAVSSVQSAQQTLESVALHLQQLGMSDVQTYEYQAGIPCGPYALLARCAASVSDTTGALNPATAPSQHWLLLCDADGYSALLATALVEQLTNAGDRVSLSTSADSESLAATLSQSSAQSGRLSGILHLRGLCASGTSARAVLDQQVRRCETAAALIQACESAQIDAACCFVTANAAVHLLPSHRVEAQSWQHAVADAALAGFARTLMNEAVVGAVRLIDLEVLDVSPAATAAALVAELAVKDAEQEIILTAGGARYAPRLRESEAPHATVSHQSLQLERRRCLAFSVPGQLRNLHWQSVAQPSLGKDDIEVAVKATGLNFRDVMYALGLLSDEGVERGFAGPTLGLEFSGEVVSVGREVTSFAVGDGVVGFAPACFGDRLVTQSAATSHIPSGLSFEAAATIPSTFFTAYYALHSLAQLREGESVLIHGAAGGVGIAALQVARWCGAEVFATAGSDEKRNFVRLLGADHVFDSRSLAYADQILQATQGRGVDVVLNSLAGEAINRSLGVLKPFGRFLELGKRDFYENTRIGLRPFRNNISYFGIDADQLMRDRPQLTHRLFAEVLQLFEKGVFHALPYQAFEARDVVDAFRHMQQARQIGKIVVTYGGGIPEQPGTTRSIRRQLQLPSHATYLVTGGLTGFGLRTAEWLVERGARHLVLLGRRGAATTEAQSVLARLERRGIQVLACACDVTDGAGLAALLERVAGECPPLRGVVHAATVIDDGLIRDTNEEQIRRVLAPKVQGALHLHELTQALKLDFFVLYSSATTLFGNPGQGNYVAANTALEALARLRRASGLPATCVRWGAIDDVGILARDPKLKQALQDRMGGAALPAAIALEALEAMLLSDRSDLGVLELDWRALRRFLTSASASKFIDIARGSSHSESDEDGSLDLRRLLRELPPHEMLGVVADLLKAEIGEILRLAPQKIDSSRPIQEMGFDSLMGVELVVAVENRFGVRLPVLTLNDSPTVTRLAERIIGQLEGEDADATRQQIERVASQHDVSLPSPDEVERIADQLRASHTGVSRRMIQ